MRYAKFITALAVLACIASDASACFKGPLKRLQERRASHATTSYSATTRSTTTTTRSTAVMPAPVFPGTYTTPKIEFKLVPTTAGCAGCNCDKALVPQLKK